MLEAPIKKSAEVVNPDTHSHLENPRYAIRYCLSTFAELEKLKEDYPEENNFHNDFGSYDPRNIFFGDSESEMDEEGSLHNGMHSYLISSLDDENKFSGNFQTCTGVIIVGEDKDTHQNISILTHQTIGQVSYSGQEKFQKDLNQRLEEISDRCIPGTIDAVIVGGKHDNLYEPAIQKIGKIVKAKLGFEPIAINGPKRSILSEFDTVYFENDSRNLHLVRPKKNTRTQGVRPSEFDGNRDSI